MKKYESHVNSLLLKGVKKLLSLTEKTSSLKVSPQLNQKIQTRMDLLVKGIENTLTVDK